MKRRTQKSYVVLKPSCNMIKLTKAQYVKLVNDVADKVMKRISLLSRYDATKCEATDVDLDYLIKPNMFYVIMPLPISLLACN